MTTYIVLIVTTLYKSGKLKHMFRQLSTVFSGFLLPLLFLGSAGASSAQPASPSPTAHERTLLAESFTKEKLWMWQKRLNLQDWDMSAWRWCAVPN